MIAHLQVINNNNKLKYRIKKKICFKNLMYKTMNRKNNIAKVTHQMMVYPLHCQYQNQNFNSIYH
jgi:hypothetical protein